MTRKFPGVCIDYGHGGEIDGKYQNPSSKQYTFTDHGDLFIGEGITNRMTAVRLIALALAAGVRVWDCVAQKEWTTIPGSWRDLEQQNVGLSTRTRYANTACPKALYLSIHSNAIGNSLKGPSQNARGVCFFTSPGKTFSDTIATAVHKAFERAFADEPVYTRRGDWSDGDVDHEANFHVLRETKSSAVLGEVLFFTNIHDARYLLSSEGQDVIAQAYWDGLEEFLEATREPVGRDLPECCYAPSTAEPAHRAYAAYNRAGENKGLNYQGKPCPTWDELPEDIRVKWRAAVET